MRMDLSRLIGTPSQLRTGGGWIYQCDGELSLSRQAPPGEPEEALALDYTLNAESQVHVAINLPSYFVWLHSPIRLARCFRRCVRQFDQMELMDIMGRRFPQKDGWLLGLSRCSSARRNR